MTLLDRIMGDVYGALPVALRHEDAVRLRKVITESIDTATGAPKLEDQPCPSCNGGGRKADGAGGMDDCPACDGVGTQLAYLLADAWSRGYDAGVTRAAHAAFTPHGNHAGRSKDVNLMSQRGT